VQHKKHSRRKKDDHSEQHVELAHDESNWLVSYADMMTLLFGFFVLMYSFSKVDEEKFQVVRKDLVKYFGGKLSESPGASNLKKVMDAELSKMMGEGGFTDKFEIKVADQNIQMTFDSQLIFNPGSAELTFASAGVVDKLAAELKKLPVEAIEIEGHTDIDAIQSTVFPSNWELSTGRSSRIVRRLSENGLAEDKLAAIGYGSSRPAVPHRDAEGNAIVENKLKNRRVVMNIRLKPDGSLSDEEIKKMGFRTVSNAPESEIVKETKVTKDKISEAKKKLEDAQVRFREVQEKLKAAKELEKSIKEVESLAKKTEEIERKVQSIKAMEEKAVEPTNDAKKEVPQPTK
jgi:chemotaxis protein MotB